MKLSKQELLHKTFILIFTIATSVSCNYEPGESWRITVGLDTSKEKVLYQGEQPKEVRVCLDKKGGSGYPTRVLTKYDDQRYVGMLEGQCMFFKGNTVAVRFANPSSGKFANGTYKVM